MLRLRTLGGVYLSADDGTPLDGPAGQRRLLALLAVLASSGDAGMSRDRLVTLLWPDGDVDRARHALTQSMYHARRTLRMEQLFLTSGDQVRLNTELVVSDVRELEAALATEDWRRAVELYTGNFLDDFSIAGAGDLEHWRAAAAQRLADRVAHGLDVLAREAQASGDVTDALRWLRRWLELDPFNTTVARRLVETMDAAGDRAGALRQADVHETLLRTVLELEPDDAFRDVVLRLRTARVTPVTAPTQASAPAAEPPRAHVADDTPALTVETADQRVSHGALRSRGWQRRVAAATGVALVAVALLAVLRGRWPADARAVPLQERVVVAPFRVAGADASIAFLREGIGELLSLRLNDDTLATSVDPGAASQAWRTKSGAATDATPLELQRVARLLGADAVVFGGVVGDAQRVIINASLMAVATGRLRATTSVAGPMDSLPALVDQLAARLLATTAGEGDRFAERITLSLPALRAFLTGQAAYYAGDYTAAMHAYERALRIDSTFALAAFRLALAADRRNSADQHDRALALAWVNRGELTQPDLFHLIAFAGPRYPAPSTEAEQLAAWEDAVALASDRAEVWTELGEKLLLQGALLAVPDAARQATAALRKALELDPLDATARRLLILQAALARDTSALRRMASPAALRDSSGSLGEFLAWRVANALSDRRAMARAASSLPSLDDLNLRAIAMSSQYDGIALQDGERALRLRALRLTRGPGQLDVLLAQHSLALNQGDAVRALDITEQIEEVQPGSRAHLRLRVLDALYGGGDTAAGTAAVEVLERSVTGGSVDGSARPIQLADLCVLSQWLVRRGDVSSIARAISELRQPVTPRQSLPIAANPHTCAALLEAMAAVSTGAANASALVAGLDSLLLVGPAASDASAYAHIVIARLYRDLGRPREALAAVRRQPYMSGWPRYLRTARQLEGALAQAESAAR